MPPTGTAFQAWRWIYLQSNMNKEWKGNSLSVAVQTGMKTTWRPEERATDDFYTTDPKAFGMFLEHYRIDKIVWEPACGTGNLSRVMEQICDKVYSTDLRNRGYGESGVDFLQCDRVPDGVTSIITNPPYSLADEFIKHAIDILPVGGTYIALMNLGYLAGRKRFAEIYSSRWLEAVYVHCGRINCWKNDDRTQHSSPVNYAWFVFRKPANMVDGLEDQPQIYWMD